MPKLDFGLQNVMAEMASVHSARLSALAAVQMPKLDFGLQNVMAEMASVHSARLSALAAVQMPKLDFGLQNVMAEMASVHSARLSALAAVQMPKLDFGLQNVMAEMASVHSARLSALAAVQMPKMDFGLQNVAARVADLHRASLQAGISDALAGLQRSSAIHSGLALQLADLARSANTFSADFSPMASLQGIRPDGAIYSAVKLAKIYGSQPAIREALTRDAVSAASFTDPDWADANARSLVEDDATSGDVERLAQEILARMGQAEKASGRRGRGFRVGNIAPGALLLGVLVFLLGTASDVAGAVKPDAAAVLDRQFMYVSFAMATIYFLYQEGKR